MHLKLKLVTLFIICIALISCKPLVEDGLTYDEYVKKAKEYRSNGDYDRAIAAGKKALSIKPNDGEAHYLLATLYDEGYRKSYDTAQMKALQNAMMNSNKRRYSDEIEEYKQFGLKAEWGPLAIQEFKETIKYNLNNWFAHYVIATDHFNNKRFKEAIDEYRKVIAINPNYANAHALMGESYYKLGDFKSAVLNLETAVKISPDANNYCQLGLAYRKANNMKKYVEIAAKLKGMDKGFYEQLVNPLN
jgi:tetratricopeptide (TPR) repeat protein